MWTVNGRKVPDRGRPTDIGKLVNFAGLWRWGVAAVPKFGEKSVTIAFRVYPYVIYMPRPSQFKPGSCSRAHPPVGAMPMDTYFPYGGSNS